MHTHARAPVILIVLFVLLSGCSEEMFETRRHELAHPGGWAPPADVLALADTYDIENVQAGTWIGPEGCGGQFLEGTAVLREWVLEHWPQVLSVGGYSCRKIANSDQMSVHATGRALDIMLPTDDSQPVDDSADNDLGDPIANWLLEHADEIGIQGIIWDNMSWYSSRPAGERLRVYTNDHKHHDHIHMEVNPAGAAMETPWYSGPMGPPDLGPCGDPIPAEGGTVDDADGCFQAYGPAEFWRVVDGEGHGGSLKWTNAWESDEPSNWAKWTLELAQAGRYRVEYNHVSEWALYDSAQYRVRHAGSEEDVYIDLSAGEDGWQLIDEFDFEAGGDQWVALYDNSPVAVPAEQHIIADAIRLTPVTDDGNDDDTDDTVGDGEMANPDPEPGTGGLERSSDEDGARPPGEDGTPEVIAGEGGCCAVAASSGGHVLALLFAMLGVLVRRRL